MYISRSLVIGFSGLAIIFLLASFHVVSAKVRSGTKSPASIPSLGALVPGLHSQAASTAKPGKTSDLPLPDGDGKALTQRLCSTCHSTDVIARQRHNEDGWNQIIDNMTSKGLQASDGDLDQVADYLAKYLGPDSAPPVPAEQPKTPPPSR